MKGYLHDISTGFRRGVALALVFMLPTFVISDDTGEDQPSKQSTTIDLH
jgi:hypothetical protein